MRNLENPSPSWADARAEFQQSDSSIRALAKKLGVSEKTVRNRAKAEGWVRGADKSPQTALAAEPSADPRLEDPDAGRLAEKVCGTIGVLVAEFDTTVRHLHLLREIAEIVAGDSDDDKAAKRRRHLIDGVLQLPSLVNMAERLTAAIARLADAGPGKKERASQTAKQIGKAGRFATPAAPPGATDRLQ